MKRVALLIAGIAIAVSAQAQQGYLPVITNVHLVSLATVSADGSVATGNHVAFGIVPDTFRLDWMSGWYPSVVIEACTNLATMQWYPICTNYHVYYLHPNPWVDPDTTPKLYRLYLPPLPP